MAIATYYFFSFYKEYLQKSLLKSMENLIKIDKQYLSETALSLTLTVGAIAALNCRWEMAKVLGATLLTGLGFEFVNHSLSATACIEYFTIDHLYHEKSLEQRVVKSLNPFFNAAILSMHCIHSYLIPGIALSILSQSAFPKFMHSITAKQLAPYLITTALLSTALGGLFFRYVKWKIDRQMSKDPAQLPCPDVPKEMQSSWKACNARFEVGRAALRVSWLMVAGVLGAYRLGWIDRELVQALFKKNIKQLNISFLNKWIF